MDNKILIVEDEFIVANDLEMLLSKAGYQVCGIAVSYVEALALIEKHNPAWVLLDIFIKGDQNGIQLAIQLKKRNIGFVYISANSNQKLLEMAKATGPYGFLVKPFREKDLLIMLEIASYRRQQLEDLAEQRTILLHQKIEQLIQSDLTGETKLLRIFSALRTILPFEVLNLRLEKGKIPMPYEFTVVTQQNEDKSYSLIELLDEMGLDEHDYRKLNFSVNHCKETTILNGNHFSMQLLDKPWLKTFSRHLGLASVIQVPLTPNAAHHYQLSLYSCARDGYFNIHLTVLKSLLPLLNSALEIALHVPQQSALSISPVASPIQDFSAASGNFNTSNYFSGIIGSSNCLKQVLEQVSLVASSDATVLINGESGTGKERIAKSIHQLSTRKNKPLIVVNCAVLPANLIESELFGHEKGAFTGAHEKRIGKFEQANGGTIFLDEIGEMPLDLQVKMLRVLQEKEIEKLGSTKTIKVDVRVITATNRKLEKEVAEGRFRLDLYYRLNVFPINVPPLRNRKEDIPELVNHFIQCFSAKANKASIEISEQALTSLMRYDWPGNIRELEHLIERTVILNQGSTIKTIALPMAFISETNSQAMSMPLVTMEEMERKYILNVLQSCNGKVSGQGGAAELLGLPTSTLNSKMQKLGIRKEGASFRSNLATLNSQ